MINFTVGPVQMDEETRKMGMEQIPYFRTPEFSAIMKENKAVVNENAEIAQQLDGEVNKFKF